MHVGRRTSTTRPPSRHACAAWRFVFFLLVCTACAPVFAQPAPTRVGYVDMQRLLDNAPQVLDANIRLKLEFDAQDASLRADEARLSELDARIKTGGTDVDALRRQADALRRSVDRTKQRLRDELRTRSEQEVNKTWPLINDAVATYARDQGYDLVITSPVVYASGRIDITDAVLDAMKRDFRAGAQ